MVRRRSLVGGVAVAGLVVALVPGCTTPDPYPYDVVRVVSPSEIEVAFPFGKRTVHLQYVSLPPGTPASAATGVGYLRSQVTHGVSVHFQRRFPLLQNRRGQFEAIVYREGVETSLNEDLLREGHAAWDTSFPQDAFYAKAHECAQAANAALQARRGVHASLPSPPVSTVSVTQDLAEEKLREAKALVAAHAGVSVDDHSAHPAIGSLDVVLVSEQQLPVATAAAPPTGEVWFRETFQTSSEVSVADVVLMVMVHEVVHKVQYLFGLEPKPEVHRSGVRDERFTFMEGHADYWTRLIMTEIGKGEVWEKTAFGRRHYSEGTSWWASVYAWLGTVGVTPTMRRGVDARLDALHALLLGPAPPLDTGDHSILHGFASYLPGAIEGWPEPPWRIEVSAQEEYFHDEARVYWKITNTSSDRSLFLHVQEVGTDLQAFTKGAWSTDSGAAYMGGTQTQPEYVVIEPGESYVSPQWDIYGDLSDNGPVFMSWLDRKDCRAFNQAQNLETNTWRIRLQVLGLIASYAPEAEPLYFARLDSPWVEFEVPDDPEQPGKPGRPQ